MGAKFIASTINDTKGISNKIIDRSDTQFSFDMKIMNDVKHYNVYVPTRGDYEVSVEVVDRAKKMNCNLIVYDSWIFSTASGVDHARLKGIPVMTVGQFIKKVKSSENLDE